MEKEKLQKELVDKALIEIEKKNIDRLKLVVEDMMTNFKNSASASAEHSKYFLEIE